jgi:WD40 repeat protein
MVFRSAAGATNPMAIPFDPVAERVGSPTQILDRTGNLLPNAVSPDGQWLVLQNIFERQEDLFVMHPDGTGLRRLTDDAFRDRGAAWSPDGKEIAFYSNRKDNYGIWAVRPDGSGLRALTEETGETKNLLYPVYSPTGDRLVASRVRSGETIMIDPRREWKDQQPEQLSIKSADGGWLVPMAWSPDGRLLAGGLMASSSATFGVYDVASRTVRPITDVGCGLQATVWLQDSKRVLCADATDSLLWLVDVESGRRKSFPIGMNVSGSLAASPDRHTIYAPASRQQADVWMVELKSKAK